jgi:hypothetical protein
MSKQHRFNALFGLFIMLLSAALLLAMPALAQQEEGTLTFSMSRDFGYASGTGDIQGTFSMIAKGPADLEKVAFYIDDQAIGEDSEAPFKFQFTTDSYARGLHSLKAVGTTASGKEITSKTYQRNFVSADEGWKAALSIAGPVLGLVLLISLVGVLGPVLMGRKKGSTPLGAPRNYGIAGGTICPKCGRPFAMHLFGPNLLVGKLDRCPHCGKWSVVTHRSGAELKTAEHAELKMAAGDAMHVEGISEEEKLRKELEDSRFHDV